MPEKEKFWRPRCPRCGSYRIRGHQEKFKHINTIGKQVDIIGLLTCERCDYEAHWLQFYESPQRKAVKELFEQGRLEGKKYILVKEENDKKKERK